MRKETNLQSVNSYLYHFQEAQTNFLALIKEERLQKRIRKSRERLTRTYG